MPLDEQARAHLDRLAQLGVPPLETQTPDQARAAFEPTTAALFGDLDPVALRQDLELPGPAGPIPVRVFRPEVEGQLPVVAYFHGGGWVVGSLDTHEGPCRALARRGGCVVVSVDYRLAPEHRFPAGLEDAWAAVDWLGRQAGELGGDPGRLAVAGDSAGGNLAAVTALRARDRGLALALQVLVYPVTDLDLDTASYLDNAEGYGLRREAMRWFWQHYLGDLARGVHPEASPLRAADLSGVAPALVMTCEYDPLRDEGDAYAERLRLAGVPVAHRPFPGMIHGFLRMPAVIDEANVALDEIAAALRETFVGQRV